MSKGKPMEIPLEDLVENNYNPRKRFDTAAMKELEDSIRRIGLIQPPAVRSQNGKYEVIAGIRRLKALRAIYNSDFLVPCNVIDVDDQEAQILSMSENVARQSLTPIEEARAYATYFGLDIEAGAKFRTLPPLKGMKDYSQKIGRNPDTVKNRIPLLWLIPEVQTMLENKEITIGKAEVLVELAKLDKAEDREAYQLKYAKAFSDPNKTVQQLEHEVESFLKSYKKSKEALKQKLKEAEDALKIAEHELKIALDEFINTAGKDLLKDLLKEDL